MSPAGVVRIRVATLNVRRVGWTGGSGQQGIDAVIAAVARLGPPPHILALTGTAGLRLHGNAALLSLTRQLNRLLPDNDFYYPFLSERSGTHDPPGLWLSARHVDVVADHRMPHPSEPRAAREVYHHTVEASVAGSRVWLKAVHWQESASPQGSTIQSVVDSQLGAVPAILLGDFAASFTANDVPCTDWAERRANSEALARVLQAGFWDPGRIVDSLSESSGLSGSHTVDHILVSYQTPTRLVPGSYVAGLNEGNSIQTGVACDLDFTRGQVERDG